MEIKKEKLEQIINQSANPSRLEPEQIPELELYIDQILMLSEKCALDWGHQTGDDPADGGGRAGKRNAGNL